MLGFFIFFTFQFYFFMTDYTATKNNFYISTNKEKLDIDVVHHYLSVESYWAKNIPLNIVKKSIEGSMCFGVYDNDVQIGFARVITDEATFAYLADVFILENYRGQGLSKWLMQAILNCPSLQGLRRFLLATKDAHGLYAQFGFVPLQNPERMMGYIGVKGYEEIGL
jgi:GNAT superfamily N-acetyltransferase